MKEQGGQKIKVELSGSFKMVLWIVGFCMLGIGALFMYMTTLTWPREMDEDGMTLRSGKRIPWGEITGSTAVTVVDAQTGRRMTGRLDLTAKGQKIKIVTQSIVPADQVMEMIRRKLGSEEIGPG